MKDHKPFTVPKPSPPKLIKGLPPEPVESEQKYQPQLSLLDRMIQSRREKKIVEAKERFAQDHAAWLSKIQEIEKENALRQEKYKKVLRNKPQKVS